MFIFKLRSTFSRSTFKHSLLAMSLVTTTLLGLSVSAPAHAADGKCIAKSEMQEIAKSFKQFAQYANADYCYDGSQTSFLVAAMMFMRETAFSSMTPSRDELFSGKFASSWWNYFIGRIDQIEIVSSCPKGVVAYVYAFGGNTMYACPLALSDSFSALDVASVFMHEARHIDGYPHITCSKGPRQGLQGACDRRISDGGSYAVTVETYAQLGKYAQGIHPAMKAYARSAAVIYADEAFENQVQINRGEHLLALTSDLKFHALDLQNRSDLRLGDTAAAGHIVRRAQHLVIFPDDKNLKAQYIFAGNEGEIAQSPGEQFTEYNSQSPEQKANWVDFHSGTQWNARVFKTSIRFACDPTSATLTDLNLPQGLVAQTLIYPEGYDRNNRFSHLIASTGEVLELGCQNKRPYLKASDLKLDQKYKRIYKTGGQVVGLTMDGKIYQINNGTSTQIPTSLDGQITEIVPQQSFEFFKNN